MDRYYAKAADDLPAKDLQLTAVTALFIASKNLEVDPLDLQTCCKTLCFSKYAKSAFLKKETEIRRAALYENECPSALDFLMFYIRCVKKYIQQDASMGSYQTELNLFLQEVQTISYDLTKSLIVDASLMKYKPSILANTVLFLGMQLQFELWQEQRKLSLQHKLTRELTSSIC